VDLLGRPGRVRPHHTALTPTSTTTPTPQRFTNLWVQRMYLVGRGGGHGKGVGLISFPLVWGTRSVWGGRVKGQRCEA
jgi:hypothetical protein